MKICPRCGVKCNDDWQNCPECQVPLDTASGSSTSGGKVIEKKRPRMIKQKPVVIKTAIVIIVVNSLLYLYSSYLAKEFTAMDIVSILWGGVFAYYMWKMYDWARWWTIARTLLSVVFLTVSYLVAGDVISWVFDMGLIACILVLLFGIGSKKKAVIVGSIYGVLVASFLGLIFWGTMADNNAIKIINEIPVMREQASQRGFSVRLPSDEWRFLDSNSALAVIGDFAETSDVSIIDTSGAVFGVFLGEDLASLNPQPSFMNQVAEGLKADYMAGHEMVSESIAGDKVILESKYADRGYEYKFLIAYLIKNKTGVTCYFGGELTGFDQLRPDVMDIIDGITIAVRKEEYTLINLNEEEEELLI